MAQTKGILERVFKLSEKGTTVKTEILAGLTTFVAMAYIIFVNPSILADAGIPKEAAIAATVWSAVIGSAAMGLWANFPVAVAPGMGLNAFFAYYVCGVLGLHWTVALGAVFFSGIVFLLLTVTHVRQLLIDAVPMNLKYAIVVGIGMFIAFIGLQNAGIVVKNDATVVALGHVTQPGPLLACCGLMLTAGLMARNVQGSLLIGILVTAVLGMVFGVSPAPSGIDSVMSFSLPSLAPTLMQLDIMGALMMMEVMNIDFNDFTEGFPAFMTIIMMPLTYSIASGFGFGFVSYAAVKLLSGRAREVSLFMWIITAMFVINFAMRS